MKQDSHSHYAVNQDKTIIYYINDLEEGQNGRKGYYCLDCGSEMEAVFPKRNHRYFRHIATNKGNSKKCTFTNEKYRDFLAKTTLQEIKKIKVPTLYKYPPNEADGAPNLIKESHFITAHDVSIKMPFYEDPSGKILFGKDINPSDKELIIKPDVCFLDHLGMPILFIELANKHKLDENRLVKFKRLGIDTIQVKIPKSSPEDIQNSFFKTTNTKWLFNYEESITQYVQPTSQYTEGIQSVDSIQREFFGESFKCRSHQIRELIRGLKRIMESDQFKASKSFIEKEIARIDEDTEEHLKQWGRIQEERREELNRQYSEKTGILEQEEEASKTKDSNLEQRYIKKRASLKQSIGAEQEKQRFRNTRTEDLRELIGVETSELEEIRTKQEETDEAISCSRESFEEIREKYRELEKEQQENHRLSKCTIQNSIEVLQLKEKTLPERFRQLTEQEQTCFNNDKTREERSISELEREEKELPESFKSDEEDESRKFKNSRTETTTRFADEFVDIAREIEEQKSGAHGKLSSEIERFFGAISILDDIPEAYRIYKRYEIAVQKIDDGTYKDWIK